MAQDSESRSLDKVIVRLPDGMRDSLKAEAEANNRSMNAEIVARLENFPQIESLRKTLGGFMRDNAQLRDEKEQLEWKLDKLEEVQKRFFDEDGSQKPVLTVPQPLLDRIRLEAEQNHRTLDAEALAALEFAFPPKSIDVNVLSAFLGSLVGVSAPDGDKGYLDHINDALADAKEPWTVRAGWDGEVRFYPYASRSGQSAEKVPGDHVTDESEAKGNDPKPLPNT
ncbi:Arc family DNA-binding protein [Mesorhizobium sp. ASY16-5R]|uniref:Arc family DNA-binding protein n=1 Tax=Mesorhizobium sp. ASY16-5R TaxID=3445772 RepID=UPI003F9ECA6E